MKSSFVRKGAVAAQGACGALAMLQLRPNLPPQPHPSTHARSPHA